MPTSNGIADVRSPLPVPQTIDRLESLALGAGLKVFARIDFSADALRAGLTLRPMQQLIFGNPKAGTPLLAATPRLGLDLPLRALAWEDEDGAVWLSINTPEYLEDRHGFGHELLGNIAGVRALIQKAAQS